ncbi:hypothetical protein ACETKC_07545 [Brevundimonas intermedia]|uniref:hypothetical protein n=1 Tax=Brevundimonas intermedia TaxID=74315 RepID=UPI0022F299CD|nr:hypothetical protein [Brevundimonas intermedia]
MSAVDRLVLMLRQRLQARSRVRGGARPRAGASTAKSTLQALNLAEIEDAALQRVVIQSALLDHFGPEMMNDARFQQMVNRVVETIVADPSGRRLMDQATRELRAGVGRPNGD